MLVMRRWQESTHEICPLNCFSLQWRAKIFKSRNNLTLCDLIKLGRVLILNELVEEDRKLL